MTVTHETRGARRARGAPEEARPLGRPLAQADPEVAAVLRAERGRRRATIGLLPGEAPPWPAVREALACEFGGKYAEGYPGRRYHTGCAQVDRIERLAVERARALFGAEHANVQPYSGTTAMLSAYAALATPGDTVLALSLGHGGHLTGGSRMNFSGRWFRAIGYGVRPEDGLIDLAEVRELAHRHRPKVIVAGGISYPRAVDWRAFRAIADEVGAALLADASQIAGQVAAGLMESPVPYADVTCAVTHKMLRGPRGGLLLCGPELAERVDRAVFPFVQGGPDPAELAAKAVALGEAARPEYADYARRAVANARALAAAFAAAGLRPLTGGTDTHLVSADLRGLGLGLSGQEAELRAERCGILVGRCAVPESPAAPAAQGAGTTGGAAGATAGLRAGTGWVTAQGMGPAEMAQVADLLLGALADADGSAADGLAAAAAALNSAYPPGEGWGTDVP